MSENSVTIVNKNDRFKAWSTPKEILTNRLLARRSCLFVRQDRKRIIFQKRAATKVEYPGHWDFTCTAFVRKKDHYNPQDPNEQRQLSYRNAIQRAAHNKFNIPPEHLISPCEETPSLPDEQDYAHTRIFDAFLELEEIKANPKEIEELRAFTLEEFQSLQKQPEVLITPRLSSFVEYLLAYDRWIIPEPKKKTFEERWQIIPPE